MFRGLEVLAVECVEMLFDKVKYLRGIKGTLQEVCSTAIKNALVMYRRRFVRNCNYRDFGKLR